MVVQTYAPTKPEPIGYTIGLDLGQTSDYSALVVMEIIRKEDQSSKLKTKPVVNHYNLRYMKRWDLHTSYLTVADDVVALLERRPLFGSSCWLCIDGSGVGRPVVDLVRAARPKAQVRPITIHGGTQVTMGANGYAGVAKKDLAGLMQTLLQTRRLRYAKLRDIDILMKELTNFRIRVDQTTGHEEYATFRGDKDDLVLAAAIAAWGGERWATRPGRPRVVSYGPNVSNPFGPSARG